MTTKKEDEGELKVWSVAIPITGVIFAEVEAESAEEAIKKALDEGEYDTDDIEEWTTHRIIAEGNVCNADYNEASAQEVG